MIQEILIILKGLFYLFIIFILIRLIYSFLLIIYKKSRNYAGTIIEGSELYWQRRWKKFHRIKKENYELIDKYDSQTGWTLIPNLKNKLHYAATINSNSLGERNREIESSNKKVLFFGDSFCFGEGVDDDETIPSFFEKNFENIQSINLGIHGYGIDQQYLYLKKKLPQYNPVLICFIICDNDFRRTFMKFRDYAKPKFIIENNNLILQNTPIPTPEEIKKSKNIPSYKIFFEFIKNFFIYYGFIEKKKRIELCSRLLDEMNGVVKKSGSDIIFIHINDRKRKFLYKNYISKYFKKYFREKNLNCINILEIYGKKNFENMFDSLSGHLNAHSNKLVADELAKFVKEKIK